MHPASPVFYLKASLAGTVSPLLQHWAGHHVQMSPMPVGGSSGHQTQSYPPAQLVCGIGGLQRSALTPFIYSMAYACKGHSRGRVAELAGGGAGGGSLGRKQSTSSAMSSADQCREILSRLCRDTVCVQRVHAHCSVAPVCVLLVHSICGIFTLVSALRFGGLSLLVELIPSPPLCSQGEYTMMCHSFSSGAPLAFPSAPGAAEYFGTWHLGPLCLCSAMCVFFSPASFVLRLHVHIAVQERPRQAAACP